MKSLLRIACLLIVLQFQIGLLFANAACAESADSLRPVFFVDNPDLFRFAISFGHMASIDAEEDFFDPKVKGPNFIFISQKDALIDGGINPDYLTMFAEADREIIAKFAAESDECFIQPVKTSKVDYMILAVNNASNGPIVIDERCYLTALALFRNVNPKTIEGFGEMTFREIMIAILEDAN